MALKKIKLFNLDKKGNPIEWSISYDEEDNWYEMMSGRVDGAKVLTKKTYCEGKNIGRANETTAVQQCALEVQSKIEKQRKKGFQDSVPEQKQFEVTLAKEFRARKKFLKFPLLLSAKLDGFRCYITKDGMFSRTHHRILSAPHIWNNVKELFDNFPDLILDGELYSHELDFNKIASLLSRTKNLDKDLLEKTEDYIRFYCFDFAQRNWDKSYKDRNSTTLLLSNERKKDYNFSFFKNIADYLIGVLQVEVKSFEEIEKYLDLAIEQGFEGVMLRNPNMLYDEGRSSNLVKYKRFLDSEYKIIDIQDGKGNAQGLASTIICEDKNGKQFSVGLGKGWDDLAKHDLFINKEQYIGKMATIVYQELTADDKVPRFGKLLRLQTSL